MKRSFSFEFVVAVRLMWPERQLANPPEEVENVGFKKPAVLLKGFGFSAEGIANEPAMKTAWNAVMVGKEKNILILVYSM